MSQVARFLLGKSPGLDGGGTNVLMLGGAIVAFLSGVLLFGWALWRQTRY